LHTGKCDGERLLVTRERAGAASVQIARKLIEQNDEAQAASRTVRPARELAEGRALGEVSEASANRLVAVSYDARTLISWKPERETLVQGLSAQR
jgi:hypothetical protein